MLPSKSNDPANGKSPIWLGARIAMLFLGMWQSSRLFRSMHGDFSKPSWQFALIMICLVAFGILLVFFIQTINPSSPSRWYKPSWFRNPFNYKQPLQLFDMGAFYFLATGLGCLSLGANDVQFKWLWELPTSIGIGMWLGTRLCVLVYSDRFQ